MSARNADPVNGVAKPACPHFGVCGGCQLQNISYAEQLARKAARLRALLSSFGVPELQVHTSAPLEYRNRIRLTLREVDGILRAGYLGANPNGHDDENDGAALRRDAVASFVPITQCPIAAPLLWRAAEVFLALAHEHAANWIRASRFVPDQLELFTNADQSRLLLTLFLRTAHKNQPENIAAHFTSLCELLRTELPELAGAGIAFLPSATHSRRIEQPRPGPAWGAPGLNYALEPETPNLESLSYWVPRGAFFQVNRFLLPQLVALVADVAASALRNGALAWDMYAGVGLFSRALARSFAQVTAVEIAEPAVTALAQTKVPNIRAVKAITLDFLRAAILQRERPSLIVLDPPRTGLGAEVCTLLTRIGAPTLIYVSCSPHVLAADLMPLTRCGYAVSGLHFFDLFPQTEHIETVAILTRSP